jgi:hypothetical protein
MNTKFVLILILFLGIGMSSYAQSQISASTEKKDAPVQVAGTEQAKSGESIQGQAVTKTDCKWVDANKDGVCDNCGRKDCQPKGQGSPSGKCDPAACQFHKECGKPASCGAAKDIKKNE